MQKYNILELNEKLLPELQKIAGELGIKKVSSFKKEELVYRILDEQAISIAGIQVEKAKEKEAQKAKKKEAQKVERQTKTRKNARASAPRQEKTTPVKEGTAKEGAAKEDSDSLNPIVPPTPTEMPPAKELKEENEASAHVEKAEDTGNEKKGSGGRKKRNRIEKSEKAVSATLPATQNENVVVAKITPPPPTNGGVAAAPP
ncbi:MAG: Rho termination factor N-terminal domain-containing protein, partial [Tannerellaceae bacterium]|nr:Rho termination factor N-terminal domain-containing protein [Tannerellaceae bacterium]